MLSSHPAISLVLYNHKVHDVLQKQGLNVLNSMDVDVNVTLDKVKNASCEEAIDNIVKNLEKKYSHIQ